MAINPVNTSIQGIQKGLQSASKVTQDIATVAQNGDLDLGKLANAAVDLAEAELQVKSSAEALRVENETLGTLLDVTA